MKVAVFDTHKFERNVLQDAAVGLHELVFLDTRLTTQTAPLAGGSEAVCLFANDVCSEEVLAILKEHGVRYVALRSAGYNHVDLSAAERLGLEVANVPEYSPYAVAEHTIALILALNRKLIRANRRILELNFALDGLVGFDLNGKTVGVVGLGKIGAVVAKILNGFGCNILGYDINPRQELTEKYKVSFTDLESLCRNSDIVTLHVPVTDQTKHLINAERLAQMRPGAMLINTSRGALIDTAAVIQSLKTHHLGYLGIDVYEEEAGLFFEDHSDEDVLEDDIIARLMTFRNVMITSHQAFLTTTALENIASTTMENLSAWERGQSPENRLKPA